MNITDTQWNLIKEFIPEDVVRADGWGRPWSDRRSAFNGILWILRTGAPWKDLPERYGAYQTVHRRFQHWRKQGVNRQLIATAGLAEKVGVLALHRHRGLQNPR